jgi:hypothetical protein
MWLARRIILASWAAYGVVWLAFLFLFFWTPASGTLAAGGRGAAIFGILAFGLALALAFIGLVVGVVVAWIALRQPANRTWPNLTLIAVSILGLFAQAFFIKIFFLGVS